MHVEPQTTSTKSDPLTEGLASSKRATNFDQIAFLLIRSRQILAHDLASLDKTRWTWNEVRLVFTDTLWGIPLNGRAYLVKISLGTNPMFLVTFANSIIENMRKLFFGSKLTLFLKILQCYDYNYNRGNWGNPREITNINDICMTWWISLKGNDKLAE